jgi:putative transposase
MVLGFYISLDLTGAIATGLCIAHAALPKESWLAKRGIVGS